MKKFFSIILCAILVFTMQVCALGAFDVQEEKLSFNADGTFKIMMVNDTQDVGNGVQDKMVDFLNAALDAEKPDMVIFDGDQLSDVYPGASEEDFALAIQNIIEPLQKRNIPFMVTMGNHDHDREETLVEAEQYKLYNAYSMCINGDDTPEGDPFTSNRIIYGTDGKAKLNIYVMDTNNKAESGGYAGINEAELAWYNAVNARYAEVPAMIFQHIPVKEIYSMFTECEWYEKDAIYSRRDYKWYKLNSELVTSGTLGEAPCSENFDHITGQYQAWLANGNVIGAFFAHDHVNNFVGVTPDGIRMGYNGGVGFKAYGDGDKRSVRIFEFNENDVGNYTTRLVTYSDLLGELDIVMSDILTPCWLTRLMKVVYALFGWAIDLFKQ